MTSVRLCLSWLVSLAALLGASAHAGTMVVSDIDDTVKMSHVLDPAGAVARELFSRQAFAGMDVLYQELNAHAVVNGAAPRPTEFVSGGLKLQKHFVKEFLEDNHFVSGGMALHLRHSLNESTHDFKVRTISRLLDENPGQNAVCIGDDGEMDPETYRDVNAAYPDRVLAIYIHRIQARALYDGEIAYDTAMDIALHEALADRLSPTQARWVGEAVLASDPATLVLDESFCPAMDSPRLSDQLKGRLADELLELARRIEDKTRQVCAQQAEEERQEKERREKNAHPDFSLNESAGG